MRNFQYELLTNDLVIEKYKQLTFELTERVRGGVKILNKVMLIYSHWISMAYGEKLSDYSFEKCEVYST